MLTTKRLITPVSHYGYSSKWNYLARVMPFHQNNTARLPRRILMAIYK